MNGSQSSRGVCSNFLMFWWADNLKFQNHIGFHRKFLHLTGVPKAFWASQSKIGQKLVKIQSESFSGCLGGPRQFLYTPSCHSSHFLVISLIGWGYSARCAWQTFVTGFVTPDKIGPYSLSSHQWWLSLLQTSEHTNWFNNKYCTTVLGWFEGEISRDKTLSRFVTHLSRDKHDLWVDLTCWNVQIWLIVFTHMIWIR